MLKILLSLSIIQEQGANAQHKLQMSVTQSSKLESIKHYILPKGPIGNTASLHVVFTRMNTFYN